MHHFNYKNGTLFAEGIDLDQLSKKVGTPFYCYSEATLRRHVQVFQRAFGGANMLTAFSVKANSNIAVLKILASEGAGADVVSGGELKRARAAGIASDKIVFSGVGKTAQELTLALQENIHQFNVESEPELNLLNEIAISLGTKAPIAFRVNPDVSAGGHEKIATGVAEVKFGIPWARAREFYAKANAMAGIEVKGVDVHIGSQISDLAPFETAFKKVAVLVTQLREDGCTIDRIDLGGGLGIPYGDSPVNPPHPDEYAKMIRQIADPLNVQLIFEPGRMIVGNAGILVSKVVYVKEGAERQFLIIDSAMNDLIRPALYDAYHNLIPVKEPTTNERQDYDIVGPICETGDRFARDRDMPVLKQDDLVAFMSAGAYGAVQASEYNTRPLIPEVLVNGDQYCIIRPRPDYEDILKRDIIPDWIK